MSSQMYVPSTVKKDPTSKYTSGTSAMVKDSSKYNVQSGIQTNRDDNKSPFGSLQPNKPSLTSNPFKRPFSEANPKRKAAGAKVFNKTDMSQVKSTQMGKQ